MINLSSSIEAINLFGSTATTTSGSTKSQASSSADEFSSILENLKSKAQCSGGTGDSDSDSEETVTVTQVMSDGSVLVTVYEGDKIVSQTKSKAATAEENPTVISTQVDTGSQAQNIAASNNAASMLNALLQN